jgi:hypothetical protein
MEFTVLSMLWKTVLKTFANYKENLKNADEGKLNIYYLFVININTKYLHVFPSFSKDEKTVIARISELLENNTLIKSVHSDSHAAFVNGLEVYLNNNNIKYFFSPNKYTNRNCVLNPAIRTICDIFFYINIGLKLIADVYTKRFTQIWSWGRAVTNYLVSSPETINTNTIGNNLVHSCISGHREIKINSVECLVNLCESHISGFNIKDNLKPSFVNLFAGKPTVIPCERYAYMYFGGYYNASGIDTTVMMNFQNTKAIGVLFPHNINEITYERNPNLKQDKFHINLQTRCLMHF